LNVKGEWTTYTPDGRRLLIRREDEMWIVTCGEAPPTRSGLLDVALVEGVREDTAFTSHGLGVDFGGWLRSLADSLGGYDVGGAAT
jgi:hypothetical protein